VTIVLHMELSGIDARAVTLQPKAVRLGPPDRPQRVRRLELWSSPAINLVDRNSRSGRSGPTFDFGTRPARKPASARRRSVVVTVSSGFLLMAEVSTGYCFAIAFTAQGVEWLRSGCRPGQLGCGRGMMVLTPCCAVTPRSENRVNANEQGFSDAASRLDVEKTAPC
jgi:hypothetical protein